MISTNKEYVLNQIKNVLQDNNIPYMTKTEGVGDYFRVAMGTPNGNKTTVFVSEENIKKATELVKIIDEINNNDQDFSDTIPDELKEKEEDKVYEERYKRKISRIRKKFIFALFAMVILIFIMMFMQFFNK